MDEAAFNSVNRAYSLLAGIKASGSVPTAEDLAYVRGLLEASLEPYRGSQEPLPKKPLWRKLLP